MNKLLLWNNLLSLKLTTRLDQLSVSTFTGRCGSVLTKLYE
ncbi:MAG: hypothetical protein ACLQAH_13160 [Limisphaerales bacterium]